MKRLIGICAVMVIMFATTANAEILTFDDITDTTSFDTIPDGYGGLDWDQFGVIYKDYHPGSGYQNGTVSGNYAAYNEFAYVATIDDSAFYFHRIYLTAAWNDGLTIDIYGYLDGDLVEFRSVTVDTTDPTPIPGQPFEFRWVVDTLVFDSHGGTNAGLGGSGEHFVMDDFIFYPHAENIVDIKPGSYPSTININSKGFTPVAIYGSASFDVSTVDVSNVYWYIPDMFAGPPYNGFVKAVKYQICDSNEDGYPDLVVYFDTEELATCISPDITFAAIAYKFGCSDYVIGISDVSIVTKGKP